MGIGRLEIHLKMPADSRLLRLAEVAAMLARNGYITGQTINVNGGWHMS